MFLPTTVILNRVSDIGFQWLRNSKCDNSYKQILYSNTNFALESWNAEASNVLMYSLMLLPTVTMFSGYVVYVARLIKEF